jgi:hypothetical protein
MMAFTGRTVPEKESWGLKCWKLIWIIVKTNLPALWCTYWIEPIRGIRGSAPINNEHRVNENRVLAEPPRSQATKMNTFHIHYEEPQARIWEQQQSRADNIALFIHTERYGEVMCRIEW